MDDILERGPSNNRPYTLEILKPTFKLARPFITAHGPKSEIGLVEVVIRDAHTGAMLGHGECRPYGPYNETQDSVTAAIEKCRDAIEKGELKRGAFPADLQRAAANAVDSALWDVECKESQQTIGARIGMGELPKSLMTGNTVSVDTPALMAAQTQYILDSGADILKIKLGINDPATPENDNIHRMEAIQTVIDAFKATQPQRAKKLEVSIDFNTGCTKKIDGKVVPDIEQCDEIIRFAKDHGVKFIEQPFPEKFDTPERHNAAHPDDVIAPHYFRPVAMLDKQGMPVLADESCHTADDLGNIMGAAGYEGTNIKLGKTGGLTNAIAMVKTLKDKYPNALLGIGSMASSSLSSGADYAFAAYAQRELGSNLIFIDVDSPTLVGPANDRNHALIMNGSELFAPPAELWGGASKLLARAAERGTGAVKQA